MAVWSCRCEWRWLNRGDVSGIRPRTRVGCRIEENGMQRWGCGGLPSLGLNGRHASRHTVCDRCRAVYHSWEDMWIPFLLGKSSIGVGSQHHPPHIGASPVPLRRHAVDGPATLCNCCRAGSGRWVEAATQACAIGVWLLCFNGGVAAAREAALRSFTYVS